MHRWCVINLLTARKCRQYFISLNRHQEVEKYLHWYGCMVVPVGKAVPATHRLFNTLSTMAMPYLLSLTGVAVVMESHIIKWITRTTEIKTLKTVCGVKN